MTDNHPLPPEISDDERDRLLADPIHLSMFSAT